MHKDIVKMNWKVMMRKIKQQWEEFSEDEISQMQGIFEDREKKLQKQHRQHKLQARMLKN